MGLEPTTFCMASRRSSQLSYIRGGSEYSCGLDRPRLGGVPVERAGKGRGLPVGWCRQPRDCVDFPRPAGQCSSGSEDSFPSRLVRVRSTRADAARLRRPQPRPSDRAALRRRGLERGRSGPQPGIAVAAAGPRFPAR